MSTRSAIAQRQARAYAAQTAHWHGPRTPGDEGFDGRRQEYVDNRGQMRAKRKIGWDAMVAAKWFTSAQVASGERYRRLCGELDRSGSDWLRERVDGGGDATGAQMRQADIRKQWGDMRQAIAEAFDDTIRRGQVLHALTCALERELTIQACNEALGLAARSGSSLLRDRLQAGLQAWVDAERTTS